MQKSCQHVHLFLYVPILSIKILSSTLVFYYSFINMILGVYIFLFMLFRTLYVLFGSSTYSLFHSLLFVSSHILSISMTLTILLFILESLCNHSIIEIQGILRPPFFVYSDAYSRYTVYFCVSKV